MLLGKNRLIIFPANDFRMLFLYPARTSVDASNETWVGELGKLLRGRSELSAIIRLFKDFDIPSFSAKSMLSLLILS